MNLESATILSLAGEAEEARAAQNRYIVAMHRCNPKLPLFFEASPGYTGANRWMVAPVESLVATVIWGHSAGIH